MDQRLKHKATTTKFLKENIEGNIHDLGFGNGFLDMTPKVQATITKNT